MEVSQWPMDDASLFGLLLDQQHHQQESGERGRRRAPLLWPGRGTVGGNIPMVGPAMNSGAIGDFKVIHLTNASQVCDVVTHSHYLPIRISNPTLSELLPVTGKRFPLSGLPAAV